jgi:4a-hydroxytetrahydrobiopterin dehydratase
MANLAEQKCDPCEKGGKPLQGNDLAELHQQLGGGWQIVNNHHLEKLYKFSDFVSALAFTNKIGAIAEEVGHHPDIYLTWGKVRVEIFTHTVNGLTKNDFILAAKIEQSAPK